MNLVDIKVDYGLTDKASIRKMEVTPEERFMRQPFHELGIVALKQLSQLLNALSQTGADWRDVAEHCRFSVQQINFIITLDKPDGCNTMEFFKQLSTRPICPTIGQLHTILVRCQRHDAAGIIARCFHEYNAVLAAENSQPLDLSTSVKSRRLDIGLNSASLRFDTAPSFPSRDRVGVLPQYMASPNQPDRSYLTQHMPTIPNTAPPHISPNMTNGGFPHARLPLSPPHQYETQTKVPMHAPQNQRPSVHPHEHDERMRGGHFVARDHHATQIPMVVPQYGDPRMVAPQRLPQPAPEPSRATAYEHGMDVDDAPPPLMPIANGALGLRPRSPPPAYESIASEQARNEAQWREQNNPSRCNSANSSECFTPDHVPHSRMPVEDPQSSMETEEPDITCIKKRLDNVHMPVNDVNQCTSGNPKAPSPLGEKASKEKDHKYVLAKLRQSIIKDKTKPPNSTNGASMDCDDSQQTVNSQLPTVIESNWGEHQETQEHGASEQGLFLPKEKYATYPRVSKDKTSQLEDTMSGMQGSSSATPILESVPFARTSPSKLFLTYGNGCDQEENNRTMKDLRKLVTVLRANNFDVSLDSIARDDTAKRQMYKKFKEAEFVLVCISPSYRQQVKPSELQRSPAPSALNNARMFYKHMQKEFKVNGYVNKRFIPILVASSDLSHAPEWFLNICPRETFYRYPEQLKNVMYHISKPEKLMKRFVEKQQLIKPFVTGPYLGTPPTHEKPPHNSI